MAQGTWLAEKHPEWLLGGTLLNLGRNDARIWLTDHVDRVLREQGIHLYRQDFNMDPLSFWRKDDAPDRQGSPRTSTFRATWRTGTSFASASPTWYRQLCFGGQSNDLETMCRAIALHPTDYNYGDLTSKQAFHASLFQWLPCLRFEYGPRRHRQPLCDPQRSCHERGAGLRPECKGLDYALLRS